MWVKTTMVILYIKFVSSAHAVLIGHPLKSPMSYGLYPK